MKTWISKSQFKPKALEYFRYVQRTRKELVITEHGKPVVKISPYSFDPQATLKKLRGSVKKYVDPLEPVGLEDWDAAR
jgi:prevent-host-death family protein